MLRIKFPPVLYEAEKQLKATDGDSLSMDHGRYNCNIPPQTAASLFHVQKETRSPVLLYLLN